MNSYPSQFPGGPGGSPGGPGSPGMGPGGPGMGGLGQNPMSPPADVNAAVKGKKGKKAKDPKQPTPRTAMNYKIAVLVAVVAALAFFLITATPEEKTYVARATTDIGALQDVDRTQLEAVEIAPEYVEAGAVQGDDPEKVLDEAVNAIQGPTLYPIAAGQQIRPDYFSNTQIKLDEELLPNERLMSIRASVAASAAGTIRPGDRVDIIASTTQGDPISNVVAVNVPVVAVRSSERTLEAAAAQQSGEGKDLKPQEILPGAPIPGVYVIKVDADRVPALAAVDAGASLYLAYRGTDATDPEITGPVGVTEVICQGVGGTDRPSSPLCPQ